MCLSVLIGTAIYFKFLEEFFLCDFHTCVQLDAGVVHVGKIGYFGRDDFINLVREAIISSDDRERSFLVRVDSTGGDVDAGIEMAEALRNLGAYRQTRIEVLAGSSCQSMCTVLWAAASERVAAPDACFMFHKPRRRLVPAVRRFADVDEPTAAMRAAIGRVDETLLAELDRRGAFDPVPCDVYLSAAEIAALGGAWLRLDPGLAAAEATDGSGAGCGPTRACQTTAHGR
ncbi:MAG: ATP-dependent Clp protease proteolytic subunit [Parvibaculaceae bacterium]